MATALIFVDNLRIGGIQRLALDEAYGLSDRGIEATLATLENPINQSTEIKYFSSIEHDLLSEKRVQVTVLPSNRLELFRQTKILLKKYNNPLIVSHSLRSTFILKLIKVTSPKLQVKVNTKIHQLPSLIDRSQRVKRFIYAQFSDELYCFSEAVRLTWYNQFGNFFLRFKGFSKRIELLRNGVYLPRLPKICPPPQGIAINPRLIFLGRFTFWKGLEILERLARESSLNKFDFLFIVPSYNGSSLVAISKILGNRMKIITGKSVGDLEIYPGDIHIYPTQYGKNSLITESVSLNCLEMAGIGIPSVITRGGQITWHECEFKEIFFEVDWTNLDEVVGQISRAGEFKMSLELQLRLNQIISINNELDALQV